MTYEEAALMRDAIRGLKRSAVWTEILEPYFEVRCHRLMRQATAPIPNTDAHAEARYRLDELHEFQRFLTNTEANAVAVARDGDPSLADCGPSEPGESEE